MSTTYPSDLTNAEWACLQRYFPPLSTRGRPRTHPLRRILDAIFYVVRSGCAWRYLPSNFPPWQTVFYHFRRFRLTGKWHLLYTALRRAERERVGRHLDPSAVILDSQSVKTVEESAGIRGYDAQNCVKGRKRHLLVDTLGLPIACYVTPADIHDTIGARKLLSGLAYFVPRLRTIWADAAYRGKELAGWCKQQGGGWELEVVDRTPGLRGFSVQPRRWVVEGTQPQYLQSALDVQTPGSHDRTRWAAEPAHRCQSAAGRPAGLSKCSSGSWCAMSVVPSESAPRASAPPRARARSYAVGGSSCHGPIGNDSCTCSVASSNGS
jgi:putative transposase